MTLTLQRTENAERAIRTDIETLSRQKRDLEVELRALGRDGLGEQLAEVEGQLGRIIDDPSLLQAIANAWAQLHPDQPQYERLYLKRDIYPLVDGKPAGDRETIELAVWDVE